MHASSHFRATASPVTGPLSASVTPVVLNGLAATAKPSWQSFFLAGGAASKGDPSAKSIRPNEVPSSLGQEINSTCTEAGGGPAPSSAICGVSPAVQAVPGDNAPTLLTRHSVISGASLDCKKQLTNSECDVNIRNSDVHDDASPGVVTTADMPNAGPSSAPAKVLESGEIRHEASKSRTHVAQHAVHTSTVQADSTVASQTILMPNVATDGTTFALCSASLGARLKEDEHNGSVPLSITPTSAKPSSSQIVKSTISPSPEGGLSGQAASFSEPHSASSSSTIAVASTDGTKHLSAPASSNGVQTGSPQITQLASAYSHPSPSATEGSVPQTVVGEQITSQFHASGATQIVASANGVHERFVPANSPSAGAPTFAPAIVAGPSRLEVGIFDGTHGWLKVRAEMTGAGDIATSLTVKAPAVQVFHAAAPEITSYLLSEGINIARLDVHSASANTRTGAAEEVLSNNGSGSGSQREAEKPEWTGSNAEARNENQQREDSRQSRSSGPVWRASPLAPIWTQTASRTGGWLSICA